MCTPVAGMTDAIKLAKVVVAGAVAESIAFGGCPVRRLNKLSDADDLEVLMVGSDVNVSYRAKEKRRIVNMVTKSLKKHMDHVQAVANELNSKEKIDGKVVNEIMKR